MNPEEIKDIRNKMNLTREEFAELLCLASYQSMANLESGFRNPSKLTIRFLRYLNSLPKTRAKTFIEEFNEHPNE